MTSVCVLTRYGNRAMMPSARRSLPDRHHLCPPSAAWRPLTIASPRTIPSRDAANSVSVLYFCVPYHSSSPSRRLTTRPHYLLILISRTFSVLWSFSLSPVLYIAPICGPNHVDQCDLLHAQGTGEGIFTFPARQGRISRYVRFDGGHQSVYPPRVSRLDPVD